MRTGLLFCFATGLCAASALMTNAHAQSPGTYRLAICAGPCAGSDSGIVRGSLVLFRDSVRVDTIATAARVALTRDRWLAASPNACFAVHREQSRIDGHELYAGIIDRSLTTWRSDGRSARVELYRSPDAAYALVGTFDGAVFSGNGHQGNCCGRPSPSTSFRAVRVGDPDLRACLSP